MSASVETLICDRLAESDLPGPVADLVIAALLGDADLNAVLEADADERPLRLPAEAESGMPAGVYVQSALTYLWQTACEQRDVKVNPRPVFWFCDEAHELVCNYTPEFLATARSARVASVLISQNKPNYLAAMGGEAGRHRVDAFLGNIGTKIFHANGDPETNRWASDTISEEMQTRTSWHANAEQ